MIKYHFLFYTLLLGLLLSACHPGKKATYIHQVIEADKQELESIINSLTQKYNNLQIVGRALSADEITFSEEAHKAIEEGEQLLQMSIPLEYRELELLQDQLEKCRQQLRNLLDQS